MKNFKLDKYKKKSFQRKNQILQTKVNDVSEKHKSLMAEGNELTFR